MSTPTDLLLSNEDALLLHSFLYFARHNVAELERSLCGFDDEWESRATRAKRLLKLSIALLDGSDLIEE